MRAHPLHIGAQARGRECLYVKYSIHYQTELFGVLVAVGPNTLSDLHGGGSRLPDPSQSLFELIRNHKLIIAITIERFMGEVIQQFPRTIRCLFRLYGGATPSPCMHPGGRQAPPAHREKLFG